MNSTGVSELLERAAASVTPSEVDPAARMVSLGRRSVRRRRVWAAAGSVAAAVVAVVVAVPLVMAAPDRSDEVSGTTVSFGGLSVVVPQGWRTSRVTTIDVCVAEPRTVYLAEGWYNSSPLTQAPGSTPFRCESEGQPWLALVRHNWGQAVNPRQLVVKDGRLLQVEQDIKPSGWRYRAFDQEDATGVFISGDDNARKELLKRVTWPAGPPAPPAGGLALPDRITSATSEYRGPMVTATDAETLNRIRASLAELRDPVPAGEECILRTPGRVGIAIDGVIVVLGDATCPQAISTGGGRVRAPAGLGKELLGLIVASDRAAVKRKNKN
ncbi:hypothetical protein DMB66_50660 [Actinoplanes sp. ATCC 53533]|uniref:hypothetical protein n=1 Tax=Actinoplanes sp. ATCC 53533 TaxID=1288362 RepID=UPI000F77829C|nr:hypothetical protein [Actinoplanes sp. ATCC 53533]RSM45638.1 hypothetical protein DMB66_50660 [Actinoplanes sp. ATCC 53533]